MTGRLFLPERAGRGVVVVGGSDGGPGGRLMAALLAGHGVPVLSMAYWDHPGTPDAMRDIDVEVVARACDWLRAQDGVDDVPPCVIGLSRGSELVLLAAALTPDHVGPVRVSVGSGVAVGRLGAGDRRAGDGLAVRRRAGAADGRGRGRPSRLHRRQDWWPGPRSPSSMRPDRC